MDVRKKQQPKPTKREFPATIYVRYDELEYDPDPADPYIEPDEDVCLLVDRELPGDLSDGERIAVYKLVEMGELRVSRELFTKPV